MGAPHPEIPVVVQCAMAHYQFEAIRPFGDGNGRVGRMPIPMMLARSDMLSLPLLQLGEHMARNRAECYGCLGRVSQKSEWNGWLGLFMRAFAEQAEEATEATIALSGIHARYAETVSGSPGSVARRMVEMLFANPHVTTGRVGGLGTSQTGAVRGISRLAGAGILGRVPSRDRTRVWVADEIIDAVRTVEPGQHGTRAKDGAGSRWIPRGEPRRHDRDRGQRLMAVKRAKNPVGGAGWPQEPHHIHGRQPGHNEGMPDASFDLICLDPPFNSRHDYAAPIGSRAAGSAFRDTWTLSDIDMAWFGQVAETSSQLSKVIDVAGSMRRSGASMQSYLIYMSVRMLEMRRTLKDTGCLYLHCDPTMSHCLKLALDSIFGLQNFQNDCVWAYRTGSVSKKHWARKHDNMLFYSKDESRYEHNPLKERVGYPTQKPVAPLERIIRAPSSEGDMVLDPFCGCATTCLAAERLDRRWVGIDISPRAFGIINDWLEQEAGLDMFTRGAGIVIHRTDVPKREGVRSKQIKHMLYGTQKGHCNGCGIHCLFKDLEVDHVVPQARGGPDDDSNLQLCGNCNRVKGSRLTMEELRARLQRAVAQG